MTTHALIESSPDPRYAPRAEKAAKIVAILQDYCGAALQRFHCLDLGCGDGVISQSLAEHVASVVGVEIDAQNVWRAAARATERVSVAQVDREGRLAVRSGSVDLVVCAQVYEHTLDQAALAADIWRVLRPGGICFLSGPNRLALMEEHYWLPFLSWLPQAWADHYVRAFHRHDYYDVKPLAYWQLRRLLGRFTVVDYNYRLLQAPSQFAMSRQLGSMGWIAQLPPFVLRAALPLMPNYNWILVKPA